MKKLHAILFIFILLFIVFNSNAQSHTYMPGWCRLAKPSKNQVQGESAKFQCLLCDKEKEKEQKAKLAEDKRRADLATANYKAKKAAIEKAAELKRAEDLKNSHSGEVLINGSSNSSSYSTAAKPSESGSSSTSSPKSTDKSTTTYDPSLNKYFTAPKTQAEKISDLGSEVGSFINNLASDIEANRLKEQQWAAYSAAKKAIAERNASVIINQYLSSAYRGNEIAIINVSSAYASIENHGKNWEDYGENVAGRKDTKFLEEVNKKYYSPAAIKDLLALYKSQTGYFDSNRKKEKGKAISRILIGGGTIGAMIYLSKSGSGVDPLLLTAGSLGGGVLTYSGFIHWIFSGFYSKKSDVYKFSSMRISELEKRQTNKN